MKLRILRSLKSQQGAAIVMVAVSFTALLGMTALVTDIGTMYVNRHQLINAADAAVLAGIQELPASAPDAITLAKQYGQENNVDNANLTVTVNENHHEIKVKAQREIPLFFARIWGYDKKSISAEAIAAVGPVTSAIGVVPLAIEKQEFVLGQLYTLKEGGGDGSNGNYGAVALAGTGASSYEERLKYGYEGELTVGSWVPTEPGNMSNPTISGIEYRINECPHCPQCTYDHFVRGCPRYMIIPVIDNLDIGRGEVQIVGFAAFFIEGVAGNGNECYVQGRFIQTITEGEMGINQIDYGLRSVKLTH